MKEMWYIIEQQMKPASPPVFDLFLYIVHIKTGSDKVHFLLLLQFSIVTPFIRRINYILWQ